MATVVWVGGAAPQAQVQLYTFSGTWTNVDAITITVGFKSYTFTTGSATIATFLATLVTNFGLLDATLYPELAELTAANPSASTFTLTAKSPGKSFGPATISTTSAAGTIGGAASSTGSNSVPNAGPNDWSSTGNWSTGTVPVNGDTVIIDKNDQDILYGLNQSAVTLAELRFRSSNATIGLSQTNNDASAYAEYRDDYLRIGATILGIRSDQTQRVKINLGSVASTVNVEGSGSGLEPNIRAVLLKGTSASNVFIISRGQVGLDYFGGEAFNATGGLTVGEKDGGVGDAQVFCGEGCTLATITKLSGQLVLNSAIGTSLTQLAGVTVINGIGAVAQLTIRGGTVVYNTTGALGGNTIISGAGRLDFAQDPRSKTITNPVKIYGSGSFLNRLKAVASYTLQLIETTGGVIDTGAHVNLAVTNGS